jgi:N-glycosylase/DNA lyase
MEISIPIDSRIKKIYLTMTPFVKGEMKGDFLHNITDTQIQAYFQNLSKKYNIAPLHLDSILWLDYWSKIIKK